MSRMRGLSFSDRSELSIWKSCIPPTRIIGNNASAVTMIPIPPSHCMMDRHNSNPGGNWSSPDRMVDPVVVRPETVSNTASQKLISSDEYQSGNAPVTLTAIQDTTVRTYPCRAVTRGPISDRQARHAMPPSPMVVIDAWAKIFQSGLP